MSRSSPIRLDPYNPVFQRQLFALEAKQQRKALSSLRMLGEMTWDQVYRDPGLRWEAILSKTGPHGGRLYSVRLGRSFRAIVFHRDEWLRLLTLHPDHDSAYR